MVIVDGILAMRTDQSGHYRFEGLADGPHRVTLDADALPLPWVIAAKDQQGFDIPFAATVDVGVRATARLDIAATRE